MHSRGERKNNSGLVWVLLILNRYNYFGNYSLFGRDIYPYFRERRRGKENEGKGKEMEIDKYL